MSFSDEIIVGIASCLTSIILTIYTVYANKSHALDEERFKKLLFPVMHLFLDCDFRYISEEHSSKIMSKIKFLSKNHSVLAGEIFLQYVDDFDNAKNQKQRRKAYCYLCEYTLKQFNKTAKSLGLPKISFRMRHERFLANRYSFAFLIKFLILHAVEFCSFLFGFFMLLYAINYILSSLLQNLLLK